MGVADSEDFQIGRGCERCKDSGVAGRRMTYELLVVTPELRRHIDSRADGDPIQAQAIAAGMVPLTQHALTLARAGVISLAEAYRTRLS
jgi:type IV pilus assembly protein PilB